MKNLKKVALLSLALLVTTANLKAAGKSAGDADDGFSALSTTKTPPVPLPVVKKTAAQLYAEKKAAKASAGGTGFVPLPVPGLELSKASLSDITNHVNTAHGTHAVYEKANVKNLADYQTLDSAKTLLEGELNTVRGELLASNTKITNLDEELTQYISEVSARSGEVNGLFVEASDGIEALLHTAGETDYAAAAAALVEGIDGDASQKSAADALIGKFATRNSDSDKVIIALFKGARLLSELGAKTIKSK